MVDALLRGRDAFRARAWDDAYHALSRADQATPLNGEDLELLATAAYLTGRNDDWQCFLERAHHAHVGAGEPFSAARTAFWLGLLLSFRGETALSGGWLARAKRLVEGRDCVEQGYLLLPEAEQQLARGDPESADTTAAHAAGIGERFRDPDLIACARHVQGRALVTSGRVESGLSLLDEVMLPVIAGELSPIVIGLIYCSVIEACQQICAASRAREWTSALARWCDRQPGMVAFTGTCLVYRAEILQLTGAWPDAMAEARRASERLAQGAGPAFYRQAEMHRLRGDFTRALDAYRSASQLGYDPQPGLALLRVAEGQLEAARASIRRVIDASTGPLRRAKLLPALVEIMLVAGDVDAAAAACRELEGLAATFPTDVLQATAAHARGAVDLAAGDARAAQAALRRAADLWRRIEAPYEAARVRVLTALACRALGDGEAAGLELAAARIVFERLGAAPDLAQLESIAGHGHRHRLTSRELQVLRLVAAGKTNKAIAAQLSLSERTIDRHVSNIFTKLEVTSRAAATAYGYDHNLL